MNEKRGKELRLAGICGKSEQVFGWRCLTEAGRASVPASPNSSGVRGKSGLAGTLALPGSSVAPGSHTAQQMRILDVPMSGRRGKHVFYMRGRTLCRRLYVVPRNVRTVARRRTRSAFGAIAKAWSKVLTEEQRQAWNVAGPRVKSRPRLWQSGPQTGEMHFEGITSARATIGRGMLLWPPEPVVFGPNPVEGCALSYVNGQARLRLKVPGPVTEDIMVFGQAPCSAGREKWRHGAYLGLLPAPEQGESDITEMYVAKYGEPEPGKKVFIRTRQQKDGWRGREQDLGAVVPAKIRSPKAEIRIPSADWAVWLTCSPGRGVPKGSTPGRPRILFVSTVTTVRCAMHKGVLPEQYRSTSQAIPVQCPRGTPGECRIHKAECRMQNGVLAEDRRKRHWREFWRGS